MREHLLFVEKQVLKSSPFQDTLNGCLHRAPEHPCGTIGQADAGLHLARMHCTEISLVQSAAEQSHYLAQDDLAGGARESIAAGSTRRNDESTQAQHSQKFADVSVRDTFGVADLRDSESSARSLLSEADQAAQTVFFMGREFHQ
jgi:hypothetical protein